MCKDTISVTEFYKLFPSEEAARLYIEDKIWAGCPVCPYCESKEITSLKRAGVYRCRGCRKDFTVRVGTVMGRSKIPLVSWLYAMYKMMTARKGVSSLQLSKELGITQKSAWFMLQRIREACSNGSMLLGGSGGVVEADETYIGGKEKNKHSNKKLKAGRGASGKTAVLGMRERGGNVKAKVITSTNAATIQNEVINTVVAGSQLCTDEHPSYKGLSDYQHSVVNHSAKEYVNGMAHTNSIESVWAVLKRGYNGVYHNFSVKHLQRYVDEFSFRLNEGNVKAHTLDRMSALIKKTSGARITYSELVAQ